MPDQKRARLRLVAQSLVGPSFVSPEDAVSAFGAMQGQDLTGVIASAALRSRGGAESVLGAMDSGALVRGYPMRGTVFLLPGRDAAWITELCAGPALRASAARRHSLGLDETDLGKADEVATAALAASPLPRSQLLARWTEHGITTADGRGYHLLTTLIMMGRLIYGPWHDGEQLVALAEGWLPDGSDLAGRFNGERIDAVADLLRRYLLSHGPATIRDFAWWTKLALREIRAALPLIAGELETDGADEASYWAPGLQERAAGLGRGPSRPLLLPGFDEFVLGYQDRLFAMTEAEHHRLVPGNNGVFRPSIVAGGRVRGVWRRAGRPGRRQLEVDGFGDLPASVAKRLPALFEDFPFPVP